MTVRLEKADKTSRDYIKIKQLYESAFPSNERAPFKMLEKRADRQNVDFLAIYDRESVVGLFYVVTRSDLAYIFYFAVMPELRGKGYGSAALQALKEHYKGMRIFLAAERADVECDNLEQRVKRRQFYFKNGFVDMHHHIREASVVFDMLGTGTPPTNEEYQSLIAGYMGKLRTKLYKMAVID